MNNIHTRAKSILSLAQFSHSNAPELLDTMQLQSPYSGIYILRMLIRLGTGEFKLPVELLWLSGFIEYCNRYQEEVIGIRHSFVYITVRHGVVTSVNDDVWHADGFSTRISHIPEQNYGWSNCYPTQYIVQPIVFPVDFDPLVHNVHSYIQKHSVNANVLQVPVNQIFCFDPYVIHRRPLVPAGTTRTFIRLSFVPIEISDVNNTPNPLLPRYNTIDGVKEFRDKLIEY